MKRKQSTIFAVALVVMAFALASPAHAKKDEADVPKKVVAIGHVDTGGMGFSSMTPEQVGDLFKLRAKKRIEKKGNYTVILPKDAPTPKSKTSEQPQKMPTNAADAMRYVQEMQQQFARQSAQMSGKYVHKPVNADALFNFYVQTGSKQVSSGGVFGEIQHWTGAPVGDADFSSSSISMTLMCLRLDPKTGDLMDEYKAKASSTKVARVAGVSYYTMENTSDPDRAFDRMFKRSLDKCIKWMDKQLSE